jgi:hypothetical protein
MAVLIVSGIILLAIVAMLALRKPADYSSDTATSYNGGSYENSRTRKYDRYG